jgi:hypothetical protein
MKGSFEDVLENNIDICVICFTAVLEYNIVCLEFAFWDSGET